MWLLDVNLPNGLLRLFTRLGITCESMIGRGWRGLTNGELASTAFDAGFRVILTRDREFAAAAHKGLPRLPEPAIVIVTIPQAREAAYLEAFEANWGARPIIPLPGTIVEWPSMARRPRSRRDRDPRRRAAEGEARETRRDASSPFRVNRALLRDRPRKGTPAERQVRAERDSRD